MLKQQQQQQGKRKNDQVKKNDERFSWKEKKIAGKETLTKNNKTYHWCPFHKAYTIHMPTDCRLAPKKQKVNQSGDDAPVAGMTALYENDEVFNAFGDEVVEENDE